VKSARLTRTILLLVAEALLLYGSMMAAVYLRFSDNDMRYELIERYALYKALLVTAFCLASFYFYDLYDFATMHDRRELILRLIQALGIAWVALSLAFYALPQLMIGRGVSLISLPLALCLTVGWRFGIHWILSHPDWGERVLIVGTSPEAIEMARETHARRDIGYRIVGFTGTDPQMLGQSLFNPRVIGLNDDLEEIVKREKVDRVVVAMGQRRGQFPTQQLLHLSLAGHVHIDEGAAYYERLTGRVYLDMVRPSWLIFEGPGRQARMRSLLRTFIHRGVALIGTLLSLPITLLTALLIKIDSRGPVFSSRSAWAKTGGRSWSISSALCAPTPKRTAPSGPRKATAVSPASAKSSASCAWTKSRSFGTSCAAI
jgi:hypothetical protein